VYAAALWWGSLAAVGFLVVPLLFAHLPTPALAGATAARLFAAQTWVSLVCGAVLLIPASLLFERPWTLAPSAGSIAALLALALFSTALALVIYFRLIHSLGSVGTTSQAYLRVPIGVAIGVLFLGERLGTSAWLGLACVLAGVAAMTMPARRRRDATA